MRTKKINLPDGSKVILDCLTFRFYPENTSMEEIAETPGHKTIEELPVDYDINIDMLSGYMEAPFLKFGDCFYRYSDKPEYSQRTILPDLNIRFITGIYNFPGTYRGGMFSSAGTYWQFLDGGIYNFSGYGWGSHHYTLVRGFEALRALCLFYGIKQPLRLKGEVNRRPLSELLYEISEHGLKDNRIGLGFNLPWPRR